MKPDYFTIALNLLYRYSDPANEPLTVQEFNSIAHNIPKVYAEILQKYLCVCKDGIIRIRSRKQMDNWLSRRTEDIKANWQSLGINH